MRPPLVRPRRYRPPPLSPPHSHLTHPICRHHRLGPLPARRGLPLRRRHHESLRTQQRARPHRARAPARHGGLQDHVRPHHRHRLERAELLLSVRLFPRVSCSSSPPRLSLFSCFQSTPLSSLLCFFFHVHHLPEKRASTPPIIHRQSQTPVFIPSPDPALGHPAVSPEIYRRVLLLLLPSWRHGIPARQSARAHRESVLFVFMRGDVELNSDGMDLA